MNMYSPHPLIDLEWIRYISGDPSLSVTECLQRQDYVGPNILFDVNYYRETYGHEIPEGMTCLEHFCRQAIISPRNPNALFSTKQWHETIGVHLYENNGWRKELLYSLGKESRFSRVEWEREKSGKTLISDEVLGSAPSKGQDICLFVHFDHHDMVQQYVLDYLDALRSQDVCIFFLTNIYVNKEIKSKLGSKVWRVAQCNSQARDWGVYFTGVNLLRKNFKGHPIILANDSVIGTMNSLDSLFQVVRSNEFDIIGAVECLLHDWHLQSFFIYCSANLVNSTIWTDFWDAYRPHHEKWFVINSHELGFSRWMRRKGVSMKGVWEYWPLLNAVDKSTASEWLLSIVRERGLTNPTTELWNVLLDKGFPFLKRTVLTDDLLAGNIANMCNVISKLSSENIGLRKY